MKTRLAIADDHPMIISGIQNMLHQFPAFQIAGTYSSGTDLLKGLQQDLPDLLLLDINLSDTTADKLVPLILRQAPELKILILTNLSSSLYLHNLLRMGVQGYILKTADPQSLAAAIESVTNGGQYIDPSMEEKYRSFAVRARKEAALKPALTLKEKEILKLTVEGCTIQEISERLFIGLRTVEYYRSNIFLKLEVKNMAALIKKSLELGLAD